MARGKIKKAKIIIAGLILINIHLFAQVDALWLGKWSGELFIFGQPGIEKVNTIHMELHISETDSANVYNWRIIYKDSANDDRKYLLRTIEQSKGRYVIDEKDGILLEANLLGNAFISRFDIGGSLIETQYTLLEDKIVFEVTVSSVNPVSTSESQQVQGEVRSYTVTNYQRAYLFKVP